MTDEKKNKVSDPMQTALTQVASYVGPLAENPDEIGDLYFLSLLWASFHIRQLDAKDGEGGEGAGEATLISLENGSVIFDHGTHLSTSPGENERTYSTGKLLETAEAMIDMLAKRGAKRVSFSGHEVVQRAAWIACLERGIEVVDYSPDVVAEFVRELLQRVRQRTAKKPKVQPIQRPT